MAKFENEQVIGFSITDKNNIKYDIDPTNISDLNINTGISFYSINDIAQLPEKASNGEIYIVPSKNDILNDEEYLERIRKLKRIIGDYNGFDMYMYVDNKGWEKISDAWNSLDAELENLYRGESMISPLGSAISENTKKKLNEIDKKLEELTRDDR